MTKQQERSVKELRTKIEAEQAARGREIKWWKVDGTRREASVMVRTGQIKANDGTDDTRYGYTILVRGNVHQDSMIRGY